MDVLSRLERRLGPYAVPHVTLALIGLQLAVFLLDKARPEALEALFLIPSLVLTGEVWRLATFLVVPPVSNPICAFFFWYLFYLMGTTLERNWGTFRYNVFLLVGYVATVAVSFLAPDQVSGSVFLQASVFLAFAFLFPDFELSLLFLLPVRIKWFALLTWIGYAFVLVFGEWIDRFLVLASISNFLLFFWKDILRRIKTGQRHMAGQAARYTVQEKPYFHRCTVCGITDRTHPAMEFRYCSKCEGAHGYCTDHLRNHEHITAAEKIAEK